MAGHPLPRLALAPVGETPAAAPACDAHLPCLRLYQGHLPVLGCLRIKALLSIQKPGSDRGPPGGWGHPPPPGMELPCLHGTAPGAYSGAVPSTPISSLNPSSPGVRCDDVTLQPGKPSSEREVTCPRSSAREGGLGFHPRAVCAGSRRAFQMDPQRGYHCPQVVSQHHYGWDGAVVTCGSSS